MFLRLPLTNQVHYVYFENLSELEKFSKNVRISHYRRRSVRSTHLKRVRSLIQATPMTSTLEIDTSGGSMY